MEVKSTSWPKLSLNGWKCFNVIKTQSVGCMVSLFSYHKESTAKTISPFSEVKTEGLGVQGRNGFAHPVITSTVISVYNL